VQHYAPGAVADTVGLVDDEARDPGFALIGIEKADEPFLRQDVHDAIAGLAPRQW